MTIFDVLTMIGGLCLFLFGMDTMSGAVSGLADIPASQNPAFFEKLDDYSRKYQLPVE